MKTESAKRTTSPRRREEARALFRNAILDAAEHVFAERGFGGARVQDIAERARIGVGTVYNHFDEKEDILRALLDERVDGLLAQLAPQEGEPRDFARRLEARISRLLAFVERHRGFFVILLECGLDPDGPVGESQRALGGRGMKRVDRFRAAFRALVEEGVASGDLAPRDPAHLAAFLGGTMKAFLHAALFHEEQDLVSHAPQIVELFLYGASASSARKHR